MLRQGLGFLLLAAAVRPLPAQRFARVDAAIEHGIAERVYPGAVVVIGRRDTIFYARGYGHFTWSASSAVPAPGTTLWDLASLTKIVATTGSATQLVQAGRLNLDARVNSILPQFVGGAKNGVTVRMLLNHTSGMPPYRQLWSATHTPAAARALVLATPLQRPPGKSAVYSDLNAMLMGFVIERITGVPLEQAADSLVFAPLGMRSTRYRPTMAERKTAAPTARFRGTPVAGVPNDQNAVALGGVSGHAGLFSTGVDLAHFVQAWLAATAGKSTWLNRTTALAFLTRTATSDTRVLGWDTPIPPGGPKVSLYGACATPTTFGHTGWTGTEIWFDTDANVFVVFLTNRSYDPANAEGSFLQLKNVRLAVADAARSAVLGQKC